MKNTFPVRGLSQKMQLSDEVTQHLEKGVLHVFNKDLVDKLGLCLISAVASVDELHASADADSSFARITFLESGSGEEGRRLLVNDMAELRFSPQLGCLILELKTR